MQLKITHALTRTVLKSKKTKITKCSTPRDTILGIHKGILQKKVSIILPTFCTIGPHF